MNKRMQSMKSMRGAGGIAIIFSLMVVSVVTAIAVKQSWRSELDIARAGHRLLGMQAKGYSEGAEAFAILGFEADIKDNQTDDLSEFWASEQQLDTGGETMPVAIRMKAVDSQGKINLNGLGAEFNRPQNGTTPLVGAAKYKAVHKRFIRLLQTIPLDEEETVLSLDEAETILEAVKDWVDVDNTVTGFGGAERDQYAQLDPPVTIANGDMISVTELLRVKGITPVLYRGLLPFVTALPNTAGLNVNTMGEWVARTLNERNDLLPLGTLEAEQLFSEVRGGLETQQEFLDLPIVSSLFPSGGAGNAQSGLDTEGLVFATGWFELEVTIGIGDHIKRTKSLVDRTEAGKVRIVRRSDANF